jgi:hypothetical protein
MKSGGLTVEEDLELIKSMEKMQLMNTFALYANNLF